MAREGNLFQQSALPIHQFPFMPFPILGEEGQRRPAGDECRVDPQFRGALITAFLDLVKTAPFSGIGMMNLSLQEMRMFSGRELQSPRNGLLQKLPAMGRNPVWNEGIGFLPARHCVRQLGHRFVRQNEKRRGVGPNGLLLSPVPQLPQNRQSGAPEYRVANVPNFSELVAMARDDARLVLETDVTLSSGRGEALRVLLYLFDQDEAVRLFRAG